MGDVFDDEFLPPPSAEFLASIFPVSFFKFDFESKIFTFDRNFGPMLGLPPVASLEFDDFLNMLSEGTKRQLPILFIPINLGASEEFSTNLLIKNCEELFINIEMTSRIEFEKSGDPNSRKWLIGVFRNNSGDNKNKPELSESERWFMEVLEESPHALYRVDLIKNKFDYVSKGFAEALGLTIEEVLAIPYTKFADGIHPEDFKRMGSEMEEAYKGYTGDRFTNYVEFRYQMKNGEYVWLNDTFSTVTGPDGQFAYQVGFGAVIDERKKLEEQLKQANESLEERVRERTDELLKVNKKLKEAMFLRQELEKKLLEISERERRFIGRELHDGLCQHIVGVTCMFEAIRIRLSARNITEESEFIMMRDFLQDAVHQIRTLSRGLCPLSLEPGAVGDALETLAAQISVLYKIDCDFKGDTDFKIQNPDTALHLFRISQEAIQNGIRHGGAQKICIDLSHDKDNICMTIENDGKPLGIEAETRASKPKTEAGSGLGLRLIDYRVDLLGGTWSIKNQAEDAGVRIEIYAPINGEQKQL